MLVNNYITLPFSNITVGVGHARVAVVRRRRVVLLLRERHRCVFFFRLPLLLLLLLYCQQYRQCRRQRRLRILLFRRVFFFTLRRNILLLIPPLDVRDLTTTSRDPTRVTLSSSMESWPRFSLGKAIISDILRILSVKISLISSICFWRL